MRSNQSISVPPKGRAEEAFRAAFERLKSGTPLTLPAGSPVTQNNVAREAGNDPSALRKSRFPTLVAEIQAWVAKQTRVTCFEPTRSDQGVAKDLAARYEVLKAQRDMLASLLVEADAHILDLTHENERLSSLLEQAGRGVAPSPAYLALKNGG